MEGCLNENPDTDKRFSRRGGCPTQADLPQAGIFTLLSTYAQVHIRPTPGVFFVNQWAYNLNLERNNSEAFLIFIP